MSDHGRRRILALVVATFLGATAAAGLPPASAVGPTLTGFSATSEESETTSPTPESEDSSCSVADSLTQAGRYEQAVEAYLAVDENAPGSECVVVGMVALIKAWDADDAAAKDAVVDTCKVVKELRGQDAREDADRVLIAYIETGKSCEGLSLDDPDGLLDELKEAAPWLGIGLFVLVALGLLVFYILRKTSPSFQQWVNRNWKPELTIGDWGQTGEDDLDAAPFTHAVRVRVRKAEEDTTHDDVFHIVDAYQDIAPAIAELGKIHTVLAPTAALSSFAKHALGRGEWAVGGTLDPRTEGGELRLFCHADFKVSGTAVDSAEFSVPLTENAPDGDVAPGTAVSPSNDELSALAACVAGWVQRVAARQLGADLPAVPSATAYGWLRGGVEAHERGIVECAQACYQKAQEDDPDYTRARIANAMLRSELADNEDDDEGPKEAADILVRTSESLSALQNVADDTLVDRLRFEYALAAARTHWAIEMPGTVSNSAFAQFTAAQAGAEQATAAGKAFLVRQTSDSPAVRAPGSTVDFVAHSLVPACRVLDWGVQMYLYRQKSDVETKQALASRQELLALAETEVSYRVRYNLACYWATWRDQFPKEVEAVNGRTPKEWGLHELARSLEGAPAALTRRLADWAKVDPSLKKLHGADFTARLDGYL